MAADAAFAQLGNVLTGIVTRLEALDTPPPPTTRDRDYTFAPDGDFIASHSPSDAKALEELRHKHQSQFQRVDYVKPPVAPTVGTEPQRQSVLTTLSAQKSLPASATTWVNENAFDTDVCNAQSNLDAFKFQFPGQIIGMLFLGTYDDAVRGDSRFTARYDHIVELAQRAHPTWNTGDIKWCLHGVEYTVTPAFVSELDRLIDDANGMRGKPWTSIHPNDVSFPVGPPTAEFTDLGCYDANGPAVIVQPVLAKHNPLDAFFALVSTLPPFALNTDADGNEHPTGYNPQHGLFEDYNLRQYERDWAAPYCRPGTTIADLLVLDPTGNIVRTKTLDEISAFLPVYVTDDPKRPPPCPCDIHGRPLIVHRSEDLLLMHPSDPNRRRALASWWKMWHDDHPYRAPPPAYVQHNPSYCPERAITRQEFNVFDALISTMLKTFCEKKKCRPQDLDIIESIRQLKPSSSMTKDVVDKLLKQYPEDHSTIVTNYRKDFERVHQVFDGERMLPQYLISYLHENNAAIEEIGKPSDVFSKTRVYEVFAGAFDDSYYNLAESMQNDEYYRELQKLAKRMRKPDSYPDSDRFKSIILGGIEKINTFLINLAAEHDITAPRPPQLTFVKHGSPARAEYAQLIHDVARDARDELHALDAGAGDDAAVDQGYVDDLARTLDLSDEQLHLLRNSGLAQGAAKKGGTTARDPRRGGPGPPRKPPPSARQMAQRVAPYWHETPAVAHPHSSAGGGKTTRSTTTGGSTDNRDRNDRRSQLKQLLSQRVPPPVSSSTAIAPAAKPGFPRKDSGKLVFPLAEFKVLSELRKSYEDIDATAVTDPKLKKLISAASGVASLLQIDDGAGDVKPPARSDRELAIDKAVDDVLHMTTEGQTLDFETLAAKFDAAYLSHVGTGERTDVITTYHETTSVTRDHVEYVLRLVGDLSRSVVLYDSCATRCFEKDMRHCIDGTFMELSIKPAIRQASTSTVGDGLALRRYNIPIESERKTCLTFIGSPMIVSSFTDAISIVSMDELAHIRVLLKGNLPPQLPNIVAVDENGEERTVPLQKTPTGMPYFISVPDNIIESEGWTRLDTNFRPYTDSFAIEQLLSHKTGLLSSNLMSNNLKLAYIDCLDRCLVSFEMQRKQNPGRSVSFLIDDVCDERPKTLTVEGVLTARTREPD